MDGENRPNKTLLSTANSFLSSRTFPVVCRCLSGIGASRKFELAARELDVLLKMRRRDFIGIYAPSTYFLFGVTVFLVCGCFGEPVPEGGTGPTGSHMICAWYFILHVQLWVIVGIALVVVHCLRYRNWRANAGPFYDRQRHIIGGILGFILTGFGLLFVARGGGYFEKGEYWQIIGISVLVNVVPCFIFYGLGMILTYRIRKRVNAEQDGAVRPLTRQLV